VNIVADENIPLAAELFGALGKVQLYPGRSISAAAVNDADVLLVRSVTPVTESLLKNSRVRFVGSTTIGLDHIDTNYLKQRGIGFCNAPGCNAQSVVEYVVSVLSVLSEQQAFRLQEKSIGIIGRGQIGSRLAATMKSLGVQVVAHDPPRQDRGEEDLYDLQKSLGCDIISIHVPLVTDGPYPTSKLLSSEHFASLTESQILINSSRGNVLDEGALLQRLKQAGRPTVVLDVFDKEPAINVELAKLCHFATPHIAGYSLEGRTNGTEMVYRKLCQYSGLPIRQHAQQFMPAAALQRLEFSADSDAEYVLNTCIRACYDVRTDHSSLRHSLSFESAQRALLFDSLRKNYRRRQSFGKTRVRVPDNCSAMKELLAAVGFSVEP